MLRIPSADDCRKPKASEWEVIFLWKIKNEMYYGHEKDYASFEDFSKAVEEYIDYYNNKRIQAKTKWMPPVQYRIASMCSA